MLVGVRQHISYQRARCGNERAHGASALPSRPDGSDARGSKGLLAERGVPDGFICPLSLEIYEDPVMAADGFSYERREIQAWFDRGKRTSPKTNEELPHTFLTPNRDLKSACQDFLDDVRKFETR